MRIRIWVPLTCFGILVGGVVASAPVPLRRAESVTVEGLAAGVRVGGGEGRALVDAAIRAVSEAFPIHSVWTLWESPSRALANGRGWSHQYNSVLLAVLRRLGFEARLVHAARVRGWGYPWFLASHAWVKVRVDDRWLDACASEPTNRAGRVGFVAVTEELPFRGRTRWGVPFALAPFVIATIWRSALGRRPVPNWVYGRRMLRPNVANFFETVDRPEPQV